MSSMKMSHSKIFGGQYTFEEFTRLLRKDLKPKTLSLVKEIYFDTEEFLEKNMNDEANESWSRLLQLDVFDFESDGKAELNEQSRSYELKIDNKLSNNKEEYCIIDDGYKNNLVKFRDGTEDDYINEALEWLKEMDELMAEGEFEEAFDVWNMILEMDIIEFSYNPIMSAVSMH